MRLLAVAACLLVVVKLSDCWARRRRERSAKKRDVSAVSRKTLEPAVNEVEVDENGVKVLLEPCEADVLACGFTVQCACCNKASFLGCGATGLIGSPSIKLIQTKKRSANGDYYRDEAGCHLRSVLYNGESLCIPGNVASMLFIAQQSSDGDCYPVYPLNCQAQLDDDEIYYQYIYIPSQSLQNTLTALRAAGHYCVVSEENHQGGIKCVI